MTQNLTFSNANAINGHTALAIPAYWRAMDFLSGNLASFGRDVHQAGGEIAHPLDRHLKRQANQMQSANAFWKTFFHHGEHTGNGYGYIRREMMTATGVAGLYNLLPEDVTPFRLTPESGDIFDASIWYWHAPSKLAIPSADILHYRGLSHDGLLGYSPTQVMRSTINRATTLDKYQTQYLDRGTMIRGSIELPEGTSKEQATEILDTLKRYRGTTGDRDVIVLAGGAKLNNSTLSAAESQLLEQDREVTKKIAQMTGVAPQYLYEQSESKYNNSIEQAGQDVVRFTFRTRIENIEDELTLKLLTDAERDAGRTIRLNADALLRGDTKTQSDTVIAQVGGGIRTKNEGRAILGLARDDAPESDQLLTPTAVASAPQQFEASTPQELATTVTPDAYAALEPIITAAAERVETKYQKAFETQERKAVQTPNERTIWGNVFAGQQATYAADAFTPIASALHKLTGRTLDIDKLAESYGAEIRRRAAGQDPRPLGELVEGHIQ